MNLIEKIKSRQNIDPIELFDISDTKEIVDNNYNAFVDEIKQMQIDEQKRIEEYKNKFDIDLKDAVNKDELHKLKRKKIILILFFFSVIMLILFLVYNFVFYYNENSLILFLKHFFNEKKELSIFILVYFFILFMSFVDISNYKLNQNKILNKFKKEKDVGSLIHKIDFYTILVKEFSEIYKLFNNSQLKQSEIVSNILALKTNYETRKFQQEMLNKKEQEIELQRKIAEYNRQQTEEQQRQTEYAKQLMQSQQRQEDLVRQEQQKRNNRY